MTVFNIIQNYGEAFSTFYNNTGILFGLEEGFFFYLSGAISSDN